ncbi:MAG TPA: bifunctional phosphopantothenoylcysteine decarboxylase/phosphopantothenate--cysteine ligase CoaBC [Methanoregula sp.]|nr:bifunctional phosphopantothenoylcysteine decarboxylase/phosphopantothenate--cysteine ligase CoaBC [Methanoregula sp.]
MTSVQTLAGKEIVVAVTGSIAAVEIVKLIHALRRRGAAVQPVMSAAAAGIIHPDALTYAAGRETICRLSGFVEHVAFCGDGGSADLLLIAPCTANTIGKIACGIDDTPVTTFASTALGSGVPVIVVPAMHHSMFRHPAVVRNLGKLKEWGIVAAGPLIEEGKAKIATTEEIVLRCERACLKGPLLGKKVLVTSGPCREPVDDIRVLTTKSGGQMGKALALHAFRLGAEVTVVHRDTFPCVNNIPADTAAEMHAAVLRYFGKDTADIYVSAAAVSDFAPRRVKGKIRSGSPVSLALEPLPKLLEEVRAKFAPEIIAFKLGTGQEENARKMIAGGIRMVLVNTPATMGAESGDYLMMTGAGAVPLSGSKDAIAVEVWKTFTL